MSAPARTTESRQATHTPRPCACHQTKGGSCSRCGGSPLVQRADVGAPAIAAAPVPSSVHAVLASPGQPLGAAERSYFEPRFGHDFADVRVHTDAPAAQSANDVHARAYTVGRDIVFGGGRYQPATDSGRTLLAHELAHTVQQGGLQRASDGLTLDRGAAYEALERNAERAATAALEGGPVAIAPAPHGVLSRAADDGTTPPPAAIVSAKSKKPKSKNSNLGKHMVTPVEGLEAQGGRVDEFLVDVFYLPPDKGPAAVDEYGKIAGGKLESTVDVTTARTKTALYQEREPTAELRDRWLKKVGWNEASANDLWKRSGGAAEFPKLPAGGTCQMDHIVELQLGGDNTDANIQPLEAGPNQRSGATIRSELASLAVAIADDKALGGDADQVKLRFQSVTVKGAVPPLGATCPPAKPTCLQVEQCALKLPIEKSESGEIGVGRVDYHISAGGGSPRALRVPATFATAKDESVAIESDPINEPTSTLIPGLLLVELRHKQKKKTAPDAIATRIDTRPKSRLPISIDPASPPPLLDVGSDGTLALDAKAKKDAGLAFTYKYLSGGRITSLSFNDQGGVDWIGWIQPSIPFLGRLDVAYRAGELAITKGLAPGQIKRPFPGVRVKQATLGLILAPEFKPEGKLLFEFGPEGKPLAEAELTATTDGTGLVADGVLRVFIPGVDRAEGQVTYKGGGEYGAGTWSGLIVIESGQIRIPYVERGSITVQLASGRGVVVDGRLDLALPGDNTATVGIRKEAEAWILSGGGRFKVPKVGPVTVSVRYNTATQLLIARAEKVSFEIFGLTAQLDTLTAEIKPGQSPVFYGAGGLAIKKGKIDGRVSLALQRNGKFTGKGTIQYQFSEKLIATAAVELDEKERLKFSGELVITSFELFKGIGDRRELFSLDISIPIPGASIGGIGLEGRVGGGVTVAYGIGPGSIAPLIFAANFYPLEENTELELAVSGRVNIPAYASLEANIYAGIALDAFIAEVGGKIVLTGTIRLQGGLFIPFKATYKAGKITAALTPEIKAALILGLALDFTAWAKAGIGWLSVKTEKTWNLARREVNTGLEFSLKAPLEYASDTGAKLPTVDQIELKTPEITGAHLKRVFDQLVSGASVKEREV